MATCQALVSVACPQRALEIVARLGGRHLAGQRPVVAGEADRPLIERHQRIKPGHRAADKAFGRAGAQRGAVDGVGARMDSRDSASAARSARIR